MALNYFLRGGYKKCIRNLRKSRDCDKIFVVRIFKLGVKFLKQIIINADDFGRHELINRAVKIACEKGCLKSATIMAGGIAFDDAIKTARNLPNLDVGIHLTLANGNPILPPEKIPSLVTKDKIFHDNHAAFLKLYLQGKINLDEVRAELSAQIEKVKRTGLNLTHVDSHQHLHHVPKIIDIVLELADAAGIHAMRISDTKIFEGHFGGVGQFIGRVGLASLAKFAARKAHAKNFLSPNHFTGIVAGESITENFMLNLIENLREGTTEVMLHPGTDNDVLKNFCKWEHNFEEELNAVTSPKVLNLLAEKNIMAVNFSDL